ncbi:MAG: heterodisulfide reductase-related iron-sulfur binding cluster [Pseudomonadota bacterium]|nr:heterodisulfide reductase-related iron-sulfur binding cluster [Pseudomonadota bacterium]
MIVEGGLRAPERKPLDLENSSFWDSKDLDSELRRQFDVCHSCRRCFNLCDSFPKLFDLIDDSQSMELDTVSSKDFGDVVDACTLCDMCFMVSCPYVPPHEFAIDIPSLFIRYKAQNKRNSFVEKQLSRTDSNGKIGVKLSKLFNWLTDKKNIILRYLLEKIAKVDINASLPKFNKVNIFSIIKEKSKAINYDIANDNKVIIFSTCYVSYNDSDIGKSLINVLEKNKVYYEEGYTECCKMPQLEQGNVHDVKNSAIKTASILSAKIDQGFKIIAPIASCALMLKSHWPLLCPEDKNVLKLSKNTLDIDEFLVQLHNNGRLNLDFKPFDENITLHTACHSRAQNVGPKSFNLLNLVTNEKNINVEKCSGHGGTWGIKKKWNKTARKVGLPAARQIFKNQENIVASTCPLAALHLQDINDDKNISDYKEKIYHPIELISKAYNLKENNE